MHNDETVITHTPDVRLVCGRIMCVLPMSASGKTDIMANRPIGPRTTNGPGCGGGKLRLVSALVIGAGLVTEGAPRGRHKIAAAVKK